MGSDPGPPGFSATRLTSCARPRVRLGVRILVATGTAGVMLGTAVVAARASSTAVTDVRVQVITSITLSGLPESFDLGGESGAITANLGALDLAVRTNNAAGYTVTVLAASEGGLQPDPGSGSSAGPIPWTDLEVREAGAGDFRPLSDKDPVTVGGRPTRSGDQHDDTDTIHNDYRLRVPVIDADLYTGVLVYTVVAL